MASLRKLGLDQVDLTKKKVLMRIDLNVSYDNGRVTNWRRLKEALPTIRYCLERDASIVLISHIGRPGGKFVGPLSLRPMAVELSRHLNKEVEFLPDCIGSDVQKRCSELTPGEIVLLENLRFHPEEIGEGVSKQRVNAFREALSSLGDVYIQDAFGAAHRPHSSILGISIPQRAAGLLMMKELDVFDEVLGSPAKPMLAVIGGKKVTKKLKMIRHLATKVDSMIIAGGVGIAVKKAMGMAVGNVMFDIDCEEEIKEILSIIEKHSVNLYLPVDFLIADRFSFDAAIDTATDAGIPAGMMALDIGPRSRELFQHVINESQTILWNGPVGAYEFGKFAAGTKFVMDCLTEMASTGSTVIVCGKDTCEACKIWGTEDKITHMSIGDAVSTLLLSGQSLPGVDALSPHPLASSESKGVHRKREGVTVDEATKEKVQMWKEQVLSETGKFQFHVAVDVGGTNTRVVLGFPDGRFLTITKFLASDLATLKGGLFSISEQLKGPLGSIGAAGAVVDVAGPVTDNFQTVELTNYRSDKDGNPESRTMRTEDLPPFLFPKGKTRFMNDLEAACFGLIKLNTEGHIEDYFSSLQEGRGDRNISLHPDNTYLVCAVGTGLGSGVIKFSSGQMHEVIPLEAGHCIVPPLPPQHPDRSFTERVNKYLSGRLYENESDIEWEDVCSGRGIANCFAAIEFLKTGKDVPLEHQAPIIAGRALTAQRMHEHSMRKEATLSVSLSSRKKDEKLAAHDALTAIHSRLPGPMNYAYDSLKTHYRYLARFSQEYAVYFRANAVFWSGDNQVYNQNFVTAISDDLNDEFCNHPKTEWVSGVPIYTQIKSININLLGALYVAQMIADSTEGKPPTTPSVNRSRRHFLTSTPSSHNLGLNQDGDNNNLPGSTLFSSSSSPSACFTRSNSKGGVTSPTHPTLYSPLHPASSSPSFASHTTGRTSPSIVTPSPLNPTPVPRPQSPLS